MPPEFSLNREVGVVERKRGRITIDTPSLCDDALFYLSYLEDCINCINEDNELHHGVGRIDYGSSSGTLNGVKSFLLVAELKEIGKAKGNCDEHEDTHDEEYNLRIAEAFHHGSHGDKSYN